MSMIYKLMRVLQLGRHDGFVPGIVTVPWRSLTLVAHDVTLVKRALSQMCTSVEKLVKSLR
jgi:hypothetical protein